MSLSCTEYNRSIVSNRQLIQTVLEVAERRPPPRCAFGTERDLLFDFTNPAEILHLLRGEVVERTSVFQGDPIYGFPNPQTMSNFVNWRDNLLCISDGSIWVLDVVDLQWTAAPISIVGNGFVSNSNDVLTLSGDRLGLARFMPSRESCDSVACHFFTVSTLPRSVNPQPAPISVDVRESHTDTKRDGKHSESYSCKICLSGDTTIRRSAMSPCGHVACVVCVERALKYSKNCPFCRGKVDHTLRLFE